MHFLYGVLEGRAVERLEHRLFDMDPVVRVDTDDVSVEGSMMDFAKSQPIGDYSGSSIGV